MKLTRSEKIKLTRWRMGMFQDEFYEGICDQQTGSYLENDSWKGDQARIRTIFHEIRRKYNCNPSNITIGEMIRIMRLRLNIPMSKAIVMFRTNRVSQIRVERGKKKDDKQLRVYQKIQKGE